ncbi:PAS domain S-box protein [Tumebacillus permanentifrigoris]|uniref:histidine kinase n=1 Tax=Tumebacillus permanentifrigoris TaxID=378543 RepID=A0A316DG87_9BACL|nr:PAS domain S-box protein [Tumebacillus permanentifrigoris]PWK15583.1 two-component system sporulation sensor kinase A/two-component system, sporulation sensor kinase E [Tumebacillus permanentifrigoris]
MNEVAREKITTGFSIHKSLFEYNPDAIFATQVDGTATQVNESALRMTGYSMAELDRLTFHELVAPEDQVRASEAFEKALRGESHQVEIAMVLRNGVQQDVHVTSIPNIEGGEVVGVLYVVRAIMARKQQEEQLRRNEALYQLINDHAQDVISYSTPDGMLRWISPAIHTLLGWEVEEMVGKYSSAIYHPEDWAAFLDHPPAGDVGIFDCRVQHKEGHYLWFETTVKLIRNDAGEIEKVLGIGRNITLRKQAEDNLRATRDRLESFIENHVDSIIILDPECRILRVNAAFEKMFGWSQAEVAKVLLFDLPLVPPEHEAELETIKDLMLAGEPVIGTEAVRMHRDGTPLDVLLSISPHRDEAGHIAGYSFTIRDITDRKRTEELLLQSEKLNIAGQLAAGVAHEIRNPLTALVGFVQLMQQGMSNPKYLEIMSAELKRIETIVSELLVLSKPQAMTYKPKKLADILQHVVTLIETQAIIHNVQVLPSFDPDELPALECDENQLKQVFINFLQNAIDAMPHGGDIHIEVERTALHEVLIHIRDQGIGIPPERIEKLGEPFYTTKEKGTGLGLMISKRIIDHHNGSMQIDSEVDVGTTISVRLPCFLQGGIV